MHCNKDKIQSQSIYLLKRNSHAVDTERIVPHIEGPGVKLEQHDQRLLLDVLSHVVIRYSFLKNKNDENEYYKHEMYE